VQSITIPVTLSTKAYLPLVTVMPVQDNSDLVGLSSVGADGYQDEHITLHNLPNYLTIDHVDIALLDSNGQRTSTYWQSVYNGSGHDPGAHWAVVNQSQGSAEVYFQPDQIYTNASMEILVYYPGFTYTIHFTTTTQAGLPKSWPMPVQDNSDLVGLSSVGADGYQDEHITLHNLPEYLTIDHVDIALLDSNGQRTSTYWQSVYNGSGHDPGAHWAVVNQSQGSAEVYFQPDQSYTNASMEIMVYYPGFTVAIPFTMTTQASLALSWPMPVQDTSDFVGLNSAGADGYQDEHITLHNLPNYLTIGHVDIALLDSNGQRTSTYWQSVYSGGGHDSGAYWAVVNQSQGSAELYFQPDQSYTNASMEVVVYYPGFTVTIPFTLTTQAYLPMVHASSGQYDNDFVGVSSPSPDGYQDEEIDLSNLPSYETINHVDIELLDPNTGLPTGTYWQTAYNGGSHDAGAYWAVVVQSGGDASILLQPDQDYTDALVAVVVYYPGYQISILTTITASANLPTY
jgi:hypothetical protein